MLDYVPEPHTDFIFAVIGWEVYAVLAGFGLLLGAAVFWLLRRRRRRPPGASP